MQACSRGRLGAVGELCRAEEEWQGAFRGEKGKTGRRATGVGLEAIILRLLPKRKGPNSGKRKAGFSGGSCQGVENMIR